MDGVTRRNIRRCDACRGGGLLFPFRRGGFRCSHCGREAGWTGTGEDPTQKMSDGDFAGYESEARQYRDGRAHRAECRHPTVNVVRGTCERCGMDLNADAYWGPRISVARGNLRHGRIDSGGAERPAKAGELVREVLRQRLAEAHLEEHEELRRILEEYEARGGSK